MKIFLLSIYNEWCFGLRQISSILKREGHEVIFAVLGSIPEMHSDYGRDDPEGYDTPPVSVSGADFKALLDLVRSFGPDLVGMHHASSCSGLAVHTTRLLRTVTQVPIAWGGPDATASPDLAIQHADIVCVGEGDGAVVDLTRRMMAGQDYTDIPNLWVRRGGQVFKNDIRPLVIDLDSLPYFDFEHDHKYWISGGKAHPDKFHPSSHLNFNYPVMASRGCPYACSYCGNALYRRMYGNKDYVRQRSVASVMDELTGYLRRNPHIKTVEFLDDVFGIDPAWVSEFADRYSREVALPFWCYTYPSFVKPQIIADFKRAGIFHIVMGIQTGSQRMLNEVYQRRTPRQRIIEAARIIQDHGIFLLIDLMDAPTFQTEEDNWETLELLLDLPKGFIIQRIGSLTFFRNYPLSEMAAQRGITAPPGTPHNSFAAPETNTSRFWKALHSLTQFPAIPADQLRAMARDSYLREHPETVEALEAAMIEATYLPDSRVPRRERERQMQEEIKALHAELNTLRGSRLVRLAQGFSRLLGRGGK